MITAAILVLAQASSAWATARPAECASLDGGRGANVWERAKAPELRRYCDLLAGGAAKLASTVSGVPGAGRSGLPTSEAIAREVLAIADDADRAMPGRAGPNALRGRALARLGLWDQALKALRDAKAKDERALDDPQSLLAWGRVLARTGNPKDAQEAYRALLPRASVLASSERGAAGVEGETGAGLLGAAASGDALSADGVGVPLDSVDAVPRGSEVKLSTSLRTLAIGSKSAKPLAASVISSTDFFRSAISASRIASWNWPWNSAAMRRILPMYWPTVRSTAGSSFGPMAISATTPMTTSSLQPMSNMRQVRDRLFGIMISQTPRGASLSAGAPYFDADALKLRRSGRTLDLALGRSRLGVGLMIDGLGVHRLRLGGVVVGHALLERLDALGDVAHQVGNLAAPEQQQNHSNHHDPVPNTQATHRELLRNDRRNAAPLWSRPNLGVRGGKNKNDQGPQGAASPIVAKAFKPL